MSMSLDGYIADPNGQLGGDDGNRLHEWFAPDGESGQPSGPAGQLVDEMNATGAVLAGRRTAEQVDHWGGDHHGVPIFVPSSRPPGPSAASYPSVTYVTNGIASAMAQAKAAAGDRNVMVHGAYTAQRALEAGVLDELEISRSRCCWVVAVGCSRCWGRASSWRSSGCSTRRRPPTSTTASVAEPVDQRPTRIRQPGKRPGGTAMTDPTTTGYAPVNGLEMYYEVHGSGRPLVLLHGNLSTIGVDFGGIIPSLATSRQVIAVEQQAHGHTADIDRPLSIRSWTDDTAALLRHLGVEQADLFGYSSGSAVAFQLAFDHPQLVGKLVLASFSYRLDGLHPGLMDNIGELQPEHLAGSPFEQDYARVAPNPGDWPKLIEKIKQMDADLPQWTADDVKGLASPTMLIIGDSDIVQPEHSVELFRLLGGGVIGDLTGLPRSRLAVLPGTTHVTLVQKADWLASMVAEFLDAEAG
jgi:pimeloyl-ACP methyl ester carboxylesterase/dihydrofolate reductase